MIMVIPPKVITILSAPRSGSSALSRMLNSMGVEFGHSDELVQGSQYNRYGFFEKREVFDINETILRIHGGKSFECILRNIGASETEIDGMIRNYYWCTSHRPVESTMDVGCEVRNRMLEIATKLKLSEAPQAVKDARFCLTLPLWLNYIEAVPIIIWRHPVQVAMSIENMMGISQEYAVWVWAYYTHSAFEVTKGKAPLVVMHSELMEHPEIVAERMANYLHSNGIDVYLDIDRARATIDKNEFKQKQNIPPKEQVITKLHNWLMEGAIGQPPKMPEPLYSEEVLPIVGAVRCLYYRCRRAMEINDELTSRLRDSERKLDRIRNIPGYNMVSKLLRLIKS